MHWHLQVLRASCSGTWGVCRCTRCCCWFSIATRSHVCSWPSGECGCSSYIRQCPVVCRGWLCSACNVVSAAVDVLPPHTAAVPRAAVCHASTCCVLAEVQLCQPTSGCRLADVQLRVKGCCVQLAKW
jgi:hypothetical protein